MTEMDNFKSKFKRGVSLIHKFDRSLYYSVQCHCGQGECGSIVEIECMDNIKSIQLHFHKNLHFDFYRYPNDEFITFDWLKRFFYRWKTAIILAFTGKINLYGDFLITDIDHINSFIEALQEGRDYCLQIQNGTPSGTTSDRVDGA